MSMQERTKACIVCGQTKPIIEFLESKLNYLKTYGKTCASCRAKQAHDDDDSGGGKGHRLTLGANERAAAGQMQEASTVDIEQAFKDSHDDTDQEHKEKDADHQKEKDEKTKDNLTSDKQDGKSDDVAKKQTEGDQKTSGQTSDLLRSTEKSATAVATATAAGVSLSQLGSFAVSNASNKTSAATSSNNAATQTAQTQNNEKQTTQQTDGNKTSQNSAQQVQQQTSQASEVQRVSQSTLNQGLWWGSTGLVATAAKNAGTIGQPTTPDFGGASMFSADSGTADAKAEQQAENRADIIKSVTPNSGH